MEKVHTYIRNAITRSKKGELIFPSDFYGSGTDMAIKKALSRLCEEGLIKRLAHGVYYVPQVDPDLGELRPGADDVVKMLAEKEKIKVRPAGAYALHKLGLTTQVPTRRVYITDGHPRQFTLGRLQIKFKSTSHKRLEQKGKISSLVIQAIEELGVEKIDEATREKLRTLLLQEDYSTLLHDLKLTTVKVNNFIVKLLKKDQK